MFQIFHALAARLRALFVTTVALDFESEFASRDAERKAALLRQAAAYEKDGLPEVAAELRQRVADMDIRSPLARVLPSIEHWKANADVEQKPALTNQAGNRSQPNNRLPGNGKAARKK